MLFWLFQQLFQRMIQHGPDGGGGAGGAAGGSGGDAGGGAGAAGTGGGAGAGGGTGAGAGGTGDGGPGGTPGGGGDDGDLPPEVQAKIQKRIDQITAKERAKLDKALKEHAPFREVYDLLVQAGVIAQGVTPDQLKQYLTSGGGSAGGGGGYDAANDPARIAHRAALAAHEEALDARLDVQQKDLEKHPAFSDVEPEQWKEARQLLKDMHRAGRTQFTFGQAIAAVLGPDAFSAKMQKAAQDAEQRTITAIQNRSGRYVVTGDAAAAAEKLGLTAEEVEEARRWGKTPQEWAQLKAAGDIEAYRALKRQKKG